MATIIERKLNSLKPRARLYEEKYKGGLFVQIRPSGSRSWIFRYSRPLDSKQVRMSIGKYSDFTFDEIVEIAFSYRKLVKKGICPKQAKAAEVSQNKQVVTCDYLFEAWIGHSQLSQDVTVKWVKRHKDRWRLHLKRPLKDILAKDVTRSHLAAVLDAMTRKGIREETRKALTTLNLMFDYGVTRHLVEDNPARILRPKDFAATPSRPRDRVLSLVELRKLWLAIDAVENKAMSKLPATILSPHVGTCLKMLILTGARRGEVVAMEWGELNLDEGIWVIPAKKVKNRQVHTVYLPPMALKLIESMGPLTGLGKYVFESMKIGGQHIHPDGITSAVNRLQSLPKKTELMLDHPLSDVPKFTVHDLRRSAATAWAENLKIQPHIIERMLNHQPQNKLIATYQRAQYVEEQREGWMCWGKHVDNFIASDAGKVVPLDFSKKNTVKFSAEK